jgi:catechol 2,3-dioxygenase-like lactoylglutathione lyase family enzyme
MQKYLGKKRNSPGETIFHNPATCPRLAEMQAAGSPQNRGPFPSAILETCLYVADLARARDFYTGLFGYSVMQGDERFCAMSVNGRQVLLLFQRGSNPHGTVLPFGTIPPHDSTGPAHIGFSIPVESLADWQSSLQKHGIAVESTLQWPGGGISLYFRDPDGHLLELLTPGVWPIY